MTPGVPLTSTVRPFGSEVEIQADESNGLEVDSAAQCQHIRSVSVDRVDSVRGQRRRSRTLRDRAGPWPDSTSTDPLCVGNLLVDTDVSVGHLRGARALDPKSHRVQYSVVTRAELSASNATKMVSILLAPFRELDVMRTDPRAGGRGVPHPDRPDRADLIACSDQWCNGRIRCLDRNRQTPK